MFLKAFQQTKLLVIGDYFVKFCYYTDKYGIYETNTSENIIVLKWSVMQSECYVGAQVLGPLLALKGGQLKELTNYETY